MFGIGVKQRVLTGIRPTGALHLGHYVGALKQWVPLQNNYDCFFLIADVQALTTHVDQPKLIETSVREVVLDWLAVGLDPKKPNVHFVMQSWVRELTELTMYLSMVTPFSWMESNPTIQSERAALRGEVSAGFMTYPISQAADILFVSPNPQASKKEILVPVGEDQIPHLRGTNKVARAFNSKYGPTFVECAPLVGEVGRLVGTDGQAKMSKSLDNAIYLGDSREALKKRVMSMFTDPKRVRADVPGTVEGNPVFIYHDAFNSNKGEVEDLKTRYRKGTVGDVEVKQKLFEALDKFLSPIREKREKASKSADERGILEQGTGEAIKIAQETLERVRSAMHLDYPSLRRM
ncbi:tryptophan--tRNA ligase [candidate division WWE3 bacterium CG23_combo_of_CG06-09_8_20_14_all_40_14]|uniref:Tryptophan--tRNA ligase n=1 Tax=candidate division WWE3 bacterium CG23_combo_of_CG06-09_8_20_14_all_40_14 TaxID=1975095 RepID=A0A2G9XBD2_UNCKA|nr:MAG: tryptophan--tRNA ligase [candidate division WWE3 bacterium CG23_combo_of_CG06-09_8_20_14_all_40_14]